jgi:hypothetical protein
MKGGKKMKFKQIGSLAFLVGVVLAIVAGVFTAIGEIDLLSPTVTIILLVIGLIVGLFNVTAKEVSPFLMSGIVLILASVFGAQLMAQVDVINSVLLALLMIFIPAVIIVAIKNVFSIAKN